MADFDPTFGCGKFLPGYGLPSDFVPPTSTGTPVDPPVIDPPEYCLLLNGFIDDITYAIQQGVDTVSLHFKLTKKLGEDPALISEALNQIGIFVAGGEALGVTYSFVPQSYNLAAYNYSGDEDCGEVTVTMIETPIEPPVSEPPTITVEGPGGGFVEYTTALFTIDARPWELDPALITHIIVDFGDDSAQVQIPYVSDVTIYTTPHTYETDSTFSVTVNLYTGDTVVATDTLDVSVTNTEITVVMTPEDLVTVDLDESVSFDVIVNSAGASPTYIHEWFTGPNPQQLASQGIGVPKLVTFDTIGTTMVRVESTAGGEIVASDTKTITVLDTTEITVDITTNARSFISGESVTFTATASVAGDYTYVWLVDNSLPVPLSTKNIILTLSESANPSIPLGDHVIRVGVYSGSILLATSTDFSFNVEAPTGGGTGGTGEL